MIKNLNESLEQGKSYLLFFDIPATNVDVLARMNDSASIRNVFLQEYQETTTFDLLDSGVKTVSGTGGADRFLALVKINAKSSLRDVLAVVLSTVGVATQLFTSRLRFAYAEVSSVG